MAHPHQPPNPQVVRQYDHVGIRVSDPKSSIAFYERLGFKETARFGDFEANEMESADGVRINLIMNGARLNHGRNPLLDEPVKLPGITHPAFVVDDLYALRNWLINEDILITEDIHPIGHRRITLFIRDPDYNVLEFNQLISSPDEVNPKATLPSPNLDNDKKEE